MKIKEINIIQFGKFSETVIRLEGGLNVIRGDNESGKSTLLGFIKFALYGVGRKNPSVTVGERERAISWKTGIAAGSLTVEDESGKTYRIERSGRSDARGVYVDKARIIDTSSGEEVFRGEVPGEHFLGIGAQAYDSMCNIKQLEATLLNGDAVRAVIDNLLSAGDENTDVKAALKSLDAERRRLLYTNGKGGLIFESEIAIERLKSEHKGAVVSENELNKNRDELEQVETKLANAREEFDVAQRLCDMHDDVLRLEKFKQLRELRVKESEIAKGIMELERSCSFDISKASYESLASLKGASDSIDRARDSYEASQAELRCAESNYNGVSVAEGDELSSLIEEFGSPRSAAAYFDAKQKKKSNSSFLLAVFGAGGAILLVFSAVLTFAMNNPGAMTVAFIGVVLVGIAMFFYKQHSSAKAEMESFFSRIGNDEVARDFESIHKYLEQFYESRSLRAQRSNELEGAKFRLAMAEETLKATVAESSSLLLSMGVSFDGGKESERIAGLVSEMKDFLSKKEELDRINTENSALMRSLSGELARFSEQDIRARVTPEIEEKVKSTSFERLKSERDLALHRTNQFNQYKAAIERSLASGGVRRSSDEIFPEIEAEEERHEALVRRLDAVKLAMEALSSASVRIKSDITPRIRERAEENLSRITAGKYNELLIDDNMGLSVFTEGETRHIDVLSKGTLDASYFSVRLALLDALLSEKNPPLFMDESLSQLDDSRAENTVRAIASYAERAQCVLFTCQNRDVEIAKSVTDINLIQI